MTDCAVLTHELTRRFGAITAVDNLSLRVPRGSVYGFLGPNGAGKSTSIRMLLGLIRPHGGHINVLDEPLERRGPPLERIGTLVEAPSLYGHLTGRENLEALRRLAGSPAAARIPEVLRLVGLHDAANRLVRTYSMGMRQRLGLALALLRDPELLILDEPMNGLDPAGIHEMRDLLRRLPETTGVTVFLSSHLLSEVEQVATHVGIIREGRLTFEGSLGDLYARTGEAITLGVPDPIAAGRILKRAGWRIHSLERECLQVAASGRADAALINTQLVEAGVRVFHLEMARPTLESIFLQLTGDAGARVPEALEIADIGNPDETRIPAEEMVR